MNVQEMIIKLNQIKTSFGNNSFTTNELKKVLKENGFTGISMLLHGMRHYNIICGAKIKKEGTRFTEYKKPIYIGTLEKAIQFGLASGRKYNNNKIQKMIIPNSIEEAIKLLKENGYKIYKPTTKFEEI